MEVETCSKFSTVTKCCFKISVAKINIVISAAEIKKCYGRTFQILYNLITLQNDKD